MRKLGGITVIAFALLLGGCAAGGETTGDAPSSEAADVEPTPTGTPGQDLSDQYEPDDLLLLIVEKQWQGELPTDESVIAAGHAACDAVAGGTKKSAVIVLPDASEYNNNLVVVNATNIYCPDL